MGQDRLAIYEGLESHFFKRAIKLSKLPDFCDELVTWSYRCSESRAEFTEVGWITVADGLEHGMGGAVVGEETMHAMSLSACAVESPDDLLHALQSQVEIECLHWTAESQAFAWLLCDM
jgi:hypothetical protein